MEAVYDFIQSITPENFNAPQFLQFLLILLIGCLAVGIIARLIFGKGSTLNSGVSSAIGILCIYVINVVIYSTGAKLDIFLSPLPFVLLK